jgi:hypothetical protein
MMNLQMYESSNGKKNWTARAPSMILLNFSNGCLFRILAVVIQ